MKVLILGNFELSFELPDGAPATESSVRAKERRILRFLKKLASSFMYTVLLTSMRSAVPDTAVPLEESAALVSIPTVPLQP